MNRKLISILIAGLFAGGTAQAADDDFTWSGSAGIGARITNTDGGTRNGARATSGTASTPFQGPEDKAKANEYRDLGEGLLGTIDVEGSSNRYFVRLFGENFGRDDQYLNVRGGGYGNFKYQLYQDKMPHNLSWSALTPFSGTGGSALTGPGGAYPPAQNPATWNGFDYKLKRSNTGGAIEFTANSPWHIRADYNEITMKGVRPQSGPLGTGSSNGFIEFGAPVDYKTRNFALDGGYAVKQGNINVSYLSSKFSNSNDQMTWPNFFMANGTDTNLLPAENELTKWAVNGAWRQLPGNSTLAGRFSYSKLKSNFGVTGGALNPSATGALTGFGTVPTAAGILQTNPSSNTFNGDHKTNTGSLSLTSTFVKNLDSRIFYNYYDKDNSSTQIAYAAGTLGSSNIAAEAAVTPFAYKKSDFGFDLGYRINPQHKVSGGYNDLEITRTGRDDATSTNDQKLWAEYKNTMIEDLTARLKYQNLDRSSSFNPRFNPSNPNGTATATTVPFYFRAYDVANFDQDQWKLVADWSPIPFLDLGFEYAYKDTDYRDLSYGRTNDKRDEYNLTASYGDPKKFRVTGLANWEDVKFNQAYRNGTPATGTQVQTTSNFDWSTKNTQKNTLYALMADWPVLERLTLKGSYTWLKTGGGVDFASGSPLSPAGSGNNAPGPLVNYVTDNTKKQTFNLRGDYKFDKNWNIAVGYTHEKYDYVDDQMRGYQSYYGYFQRLGANNSNVSWLSGAYANPSYKVDLLYVMGTYNFE